jgi:hypothetical protein
VKHLDRLAIELVAAMAIACTCGCSGGEGGGKSGQDGKTAGIAADAVTVEVSGQGQAEGTARLGYVKPESTHEVTFAVSNESGGDLDIVGSLVGRADPAARRAKGCPRNSSRMGRE